jgi:hypothetical protein
MGRALSTNDDWVFHNHLCESLRFYRFNISFDLKIYWYQISSINTS